MTSSSKEQNVMENASEESTSSTNILPHHNAQQNAISQLVFNVPMMWSNTKLLRTYFVILEKCFTVNNIVDENARFLCLTNALSTKQAEKYSLAHNSASGDNNPYLAFKNSILASVANYCTPTATDWMDRHLKQDSIIFLGFLNLQQ